jgi:hypothetical protein
VLTVSGVAFATAAIIGCGSDLTTHELSGLPACGSATLLTTSPMADADIREIAPLGNLNPPGHTFPTDHIYFYLASTSAPVVSPGNIRVSRVTRQTKSGAGTADYVDYSLDFTSCNSVSLYFGHVATLTAALAARIGAFSGGCESPYQTGGFTYQQCRKDVDIALSAGEAIGTAGGPGQFALDVGAISPNSPALAYVDPGRTNGDGLHAVCPIDYFEPTLRDALLQRFAVNGVRRTIAPVCGTIMQDVVNTAQGRWYFDATQGDDHHLALVHHSGSPTIGAFSIGTSVPGTGPAVLTFTPSQTGQVNLDFTRVTADGKIYCYHFLNSASLTAFIRLETASRLRIEVKPIASCGDPATYAFGANAVGFDR